MQKLFTLKNGVVVLIRPLNVDDYEEACTYLEILGTQTIFTNQYPGKPKQEKEKWIKSCLDANIYGLGVFLEGKMVGMCTIGKKMPNHPWMCHRAEFGVHMLRQVQGQGLGTQLLHLMEEWAVQNGVSRIEGMVRTQNRKAISLYLSAGFEIEGRQRHNAFINGEWHDVYFIGKLLES